MLIEIQKRGASWVVEVDGAVTAQHATKEGVTALAINFAHQNAPSRICSYQQNGKLDWCADLDGVALPPPPTGPVPTTVRYDVDALALPIDGTERLIARLYDQNGQIIPTQEAEWTFTAAGPVQYADHAVTGTDTGTALIGARHKASGLAGLAEITVTEGDMPTRRYELTGESDLGQVWPFVFRRVTGDEQWFEFRMTDDDGNEYGPARLDLTSAGPPPPQTGTTLILTLASGAGQTANVTDALASPIVVRVTDSASQQPVEGQRIAFEAADGSPSPADAVTDDLGYAQTTWTLGTDVGEQQLTARLDPEESTGTGRVVVTATGLSAPVVGGSVQIVSGDDQTGPTSTALPIPLRVLVRDGDGLPAAAVAMTWTPSAGSVAFADTQTDATGHAQAVWTLGASEGAQTCDAEADAIDTVTFNATAANVTPDPDPNPLPGSYSATSPHWGHMVASTVDYRIHHQASAAVRAAEWTYAASKFDVIIGGTASEYLARNSGALCYIYDLFWTEKQTDVGPMETWLAANGYTVEDAYIHAAGTSKAKANRLTPTLWSSARYVMNPGSAGWRAWRARVASQMIVPLQRVGFFFDEFSTSAIKKYVPAATLEYATYAAYFADIATVLTAQKALVPAGHNHLNAAQNFNKADDRPLILAAGAVMTEYVNNPYGNQRWADVDWLTSRGAVVELATGVSPGSKNDPRFGATAGNYSTVAERCLMWEYAAYLMCTVPANMYLCRFQPYGLNWSLPMSSCWLAGFERNIGLATGPRRIHASGADGVGQVYQVWIREFSGGPKDAIVLIRPQGGKATSGSFSGNYDYSNASAVSVGSFPSGSWQLLSATNTLGSTVTSVSLRAGEAVVLIKV